MGTGSDTTYKLALRRPLVSSAARAPGAWRSELRLGAAVVLCLATLWLVELSTLREHLARLSLRTIAVIIALHYVIVVLTALRFARIARGAGATVSTRDAVRLTFGSTLANMLLPTSLAGDAGRVWMIHRHGLTARSALGVGVFDRIIGLASLGLIVLGGALLVPSLAPLAGSVSLILLVLGSAAGLASAVRLGRAGLVAATVSYSLAAHAGSIAIALAFAFGATPTVAAGIGAAVLWPLGVLRRASNG